MVAESTRIDLVSETSQPSERSSRTDWEQDHVRELREAAKREMNLLASKESRRVSVLRVAVLLALLILAVVFSLGFRAYLRFVRMKQFRQEFKSNANSIVGQFHHAVERKLETLESLSTAITVSAYHQADNTSFPLFLTGYEVMASSARILADAVSIAFYILVTDETRDTWEAHVAANGLASQEKALEIDSALRLSQDKHFGFEQNYSKWWRFNSGKIPKAIYNLAGGWNHTKAPYNSGPYLCFAGTSPVLPSPALLNFNILSLPAAGSYHRETLKTEQVVLGRVENFFKEEAESSYFFHASLELGQYRHGFGVFGDDPATGLSFPVFDSFNRESRRLIGTLGTTLSWHGLFLTRSPLPKSADGIICVFKNTFHQTFSFRVDATGPTYLGNGDHHDVSYDELGVFADIGDRLTRNASPVTRSYASVEVNSKFSGYNLTVFPSKRTESQYPQLEYSSASFIMVVIIIYSVTVPIFLCYDCSVTRRQRIVSTQAISNGVIVASMFPEDIRAKVFEEHLRRDSNNYDHWFCNPDREERHFESPVAVVRTYEEMTVLFADLSDFTQWSASHQPEQVVELLETLFRGFDNSAFKLRVFKVETVGDCYMAVTSCPEFQPDHAVRMAMFSRELLSKAAQVTSKLMKKFGGESSMLQLRIGIHTGGCVGGVLRGQRPRFQLFGDVINTAARLEQTGLPGKIHISEATANELSAQGKSNWLETREDMVNAKGKGALQTYFLKPEISEEDRKLEV